jgi:LPXTG-site transpeptidase (sortase) family protein
MAVQVYRKKQPTVYRPKERARVQKKFARRIFFLHRLAPFFLVSVGIFLLASVIVPIIFSEVSSGQELRVSAEGDAAEKTNGSILGVIKRENLLPTPKPTPTLIATDLDYTDLSNWFPDHSVPFIPTSEEKRYILSIPKIGIENAEVVLGGSNLDQHLIQYPGTGLPGDMGSPVIFGHSVLRQFYNPKETNPRRYISIFSTIMTLKDGDPIYIKDGTTTFTYRVSSKTEVKPTDRYILEQQLDTRQLKLVTCTPEGTTLRRGVVTAILDESGQ